eukprot:Sdes_comp18456_c0_seq1m8421
MKINNFPPTVFFLVLSSLLFCFTLSQNPALGTTNADCGGVACSPLAQCQTEGNYSFCVCGEGYTGNGSFCSVTLPIVGSYFTNYGKQTQKEVFIGNVGSMDESGLYSWVEIFREQGRAVALNGITNFYFASKYSAFFWTYFRSQLYICQQVYDAETQEIAVNAPPPNASNPIVSGCGESSFPWTMLTLESSVNNHTNPLYPPEYLGNIFTILFLNRGGFPLSCLLNIIFSIVVAGRVNLDQASFAGIVIGALILGVLLSLLGCYCYRRHKSRKESSLSFVRKPSCSAIN